MPDTPNDLARFDLPDALRTTTGDANTHHLPATHINTPDCTAEVYLLGATVTAWQPVGQEPVLYTSAKSRYENGQPIRGGIPLCFPWFGGHPSDPDQPSHGLVRTAQWNLTETSQTDAGVQVTFNAELEGLAATYQVTFGKEMTAAFTMTNTAEEARCVEAALHTYLAVSDATAVSIAGLQDAVYLDKLQNGDQQPPAGEPITFTQETDRVYLDTADDCVLTDPGWNRTITVAKQGSEATVVWNPWIDKAARLEDLGDDEWKNFCCIETACVGEHAITLASGASHTVSTTLSVQAL